MTIWVFVPFGLGTPDDTSSPFGFGVPRFRNACCPHIESWTQRGLGVRVVLFEGVEVAKRTTVSGMSIVPTLSL